MTKYDIFTEGGTWMLCSRLPVIADILRLRKEATRRIIAECEPEGGSCLLCFNGCGTLADKLVVRRALQ
jgi:hypothetical protein